MLRPMIPYSPVTDFFIRFFCGWLNTGPSAGTVVLKFGPVHSWEQFLTHWGWVKMAAIIWTSDSIVYWYIYVSLGLHQFMGQSSQYNTVQYNTSGCNGVIDLVKCACLDGPVVMTSLSIFPCPCLSFDHHSGHHGLAPKFNKFRGKKNEFEIVVCKIVAILSWPQCVTLPYMVSCTRDYSVCAPNQRETTLHCNVVSHWLGAYTKWSLHSHVWQNLSMVGCNV